jgi:hypothetical protein
MSANYHSACRGRSRAEFIAKPGVAVEEADETEHCLLVLIESSIGTGPEWDALYKESRERRAILKASHDTARRNHERQLAERSKSIKSTKAKSSNPRILKSPPCQSAPAATGR